MTIIKKNNLTKMLSTFTKNEMKCFGKFVASPYFQTERNLTPLYSYLKKYHPAFDSKHLSEEKIFCALYPEKKFEPKKSSLIIRVLFSQMTNLAKKFLAYEQYESGELEYEFNNSIARAFANKKLVKDAFQSILKNSDTMVAHDFPEVYHERISTNNWLTHLSVMTEKPKDAFNKYEKNNILYIYAYMISSLASFLNNNSAYTNNDFSFKGFKLTKSFVEGFDPQLFDKECADDGFETKNITLFNYYIIKSHLDENDKENLLKAAEVCYRFFGNVSRDVQMSTFIQLSNGFYIRKHLDRIYSVKANELVDFAWSNGLLTTQKDGYLDVRAYEQVLRIKAYLLNAQELRQFIDTYLEKVAPQYKNDLKNFSMAHVYFKEKLFDKCLEFTSRSDSLSIGTKIAKYELKICSFYELKFYEEALYAADSFKHYIREHKEIGPIMWESSMDFIKRFRTLMQLKSGKKDIIPEKIRDTEKYTIFGDWFIEKVNELQ